MKLGIIGAMTGEVETLKQNIRYHEILEEENRRLRLQQEEEELMAKRLSQKVSAIKESMENQGLYDDNAIEISLLILSLAARADANRNLARKLAADMNHYKPKNERPVSKKIGSGARSACQDTED